MDDDGATPLGLMRCLSMLTDEAATLLLPETVSALQDALAVCQQESTLSRDDWPASGMGALH